MNEIFIKQESSVYSWRNNKTTASDVAVNKSATASFFIQKFSKSSMSIHFKKMVSLSFLLLLTFKVFAPGTKSIMIMESPAIEPFRTLIHAIGMVETSFDTLAYNPEEEAVGYFQIRPIRIEDYNNRTGSSYTAQDMYNYKISEEIFLYYASQIGPYDLEQIAKNWNGSGPRTSFYWKQVKKFL